MIAGLRFSDSQQCLCMCCMCSELKRILPSSHIPEIPQQRLVPCFSLKFGCKAVMREEERFALVLGPQKPFPHFPPLPLSRVVSSSAAGRARLGGSGEAGWWTLSSPAWGRGSVCPGGVLQTQDRLIKCIVDYSCWFWHHLMTWQTTGALWKKHFLCVCLSCPDSSLSRVCSQHKIKVF